MSSETPPTLGDGRWVQRDLDTLNVRDFLEDAARTVPDAPFLVHAGRSISYADFNNGVDRAASAWHGLGVRAGDRVAFMLENRPEFLWAWLGLAKLGAILIAINTRWQGDEIDGFLALTQPRFALIGPQFRDVFRSSGPAAGSIQQCLTLGSHEEMTDFSALRDRSTGQFPRPPLASGDPLSFISTSGTTGRPKAVVQTHGNYVLTGEGYAHWIELRQGERIYVCLPLFHINSQAYSVMGAIAARATIVLVERFSATSFWRDMAEYRINVFNYIGSMLAILLKREVTPEERGHAVRLTYGGPAFPGTVRQQLEERFGLTLISGIGMSENTFGLIESLHEGRKSGSLGKPRQHPDPRIKNEARVVDDHGHDVPRGEVGELIYRNPVLMKGYYRNSEETTRTIREGWLYTGDLVRQDEEGFFYFVDRKKDVIRVRGENVASAEVEAVLVEHPAVHEAAVVGVPSELTDEEVAAFVVPATGSSVDTGALVEWCGRRLARFKVPRYIWSIDAFPRTETLRVEKHHLRDRARKLLSLESEKA